MKCIISSRGSVCPNEAKYFYARLDHHERKDESGLQVGTHRCEDHKFMGTAGGGIYWSEITEKEYLVLRIMKQ